MTPPGARKGIGGTTESPAPPIPRDIAFIFPTQSLPVSRVFFFGGGGEVMGTKVAAALRPPTCCCPSPPAPRFSRTRETFCSHASLVVCSRGYRVATVWRTHSPVTQLRCNESRGASKGENSVRSIRGLEYVPTATPPSLGFHYYGWAGLCS